MQKRERKEFQDAKKEMLRKLKADKRARGIAVSDSDSDDGGSGGKKKVKKGFDAVKEGMKIVETLYTEERNPGVAKTCFKTYHTFCKNILKDPSEEKFRTLNLNNEKI
jgi:hypothetical protein